MNLDTRYLVMMRMMTADVKPSLREMAKELGVSIGSVQDRVYHLTKEGLIYGGGKGVPRSLRLTEIGKMRLTREGRNG